MLSEGLRLMTFLTNLIILISFIWLFVWLQRDAKIAFIRRHKMALTIGLTYCFLLFFHTDSLLNIANERHPAGYGWTFLNFQIITVLYALLSTRTKPMFVAMLMIVGVWLVWMCGLTHWWLVVVSLLLLYGAHRFAPQISDQPLVYYPFGLLFAAPFFAVNALKLGGIDVGWAWQIGAYVILESVLWTVNHQVNSRSQKAVRLRQEATVDALSGLINFGQFDHDLQAAFARFQTSGELYALYTFDIDHFKQINDTYGHLAGNVVLKAVAAYLKAYADGLEYRAKVYRTGGEEFSILLFDVVESFDRAKAIAQDLKHGIGALELTFDEQPLTITISLGQDRATSDDKNYLDIYRRADAFLYTSKNNGRDALTVRGQLIR